MTTSTDVQIRRVSVEFLRPGRSHNQLLSPYTQYLAVCNDAGAGVVTVPYEHRVFERRLKELRYETGDQADRLEMLHEIGTDIGRILEAVPGLTGALMDANAASATLIHLRVTLSAAELALLPFELAEVRFGSIHPDAAAGGGYPAHSHRGLRRHGLAATSTHSVRRRRPGLRAVSGTPEATGAGHRALPVFEGGRLSRR
ncbi:MAG: hypothetical protein ABI652_05170 [Acidobacteriota bacterium]